MPALRDWTIRENKWRASRYGVDAEIIRNERGVLMSLRENILTWVERLLPTAKVLGCRDELGLIPSILQHGTSHVRQRALTASGKSLVEVVESMTAELEEDAFSSV